MNSNSSSPRLPEAFAFAFGFALALRGVDLASPSKAFGTPPLGRMAWPLAVALVSVKETLNNVKKPFSAGLPYSEEGCQGHRRAGEEGDGEVVVDDPSSKGEGDSVGEGRRRGAGGADEEG